MGLFPIISEPFSFAYFLAAVIPIAILQVWAIIYLIDPFKYEKSYYLFFGVYGIVNTYIIYLVIQKFLYLNIGVKGYLPFIMIWGMFVAILVGINWLNLKALYTGTYYKLQQMKTISVAWVGIGGAGYVIGQILLSVFYTEFATYIILISCIFLLSILTAFFSINIHRYFFICRNLDIVKKVEPNFGLPKNERKFKYIYRQI